MGGRRCKSWPLPRAVTSRFWWPCGTPGRMPLSTSRMQAHLNRDACSVVVDRSRRCHPQPRTLCLQHSIVVDGLLEAGMCRRPDVARVVSVSILDARQQGDDIVMVTYCSQRTRSVVLRHTMIACRDCRANPDAVILCKNVSSSSFFNSSNALQVGAVALVRPVLISSWMLRR